MVEDSRDFIERTKSLNEKLYGEPMSDGEIADEFALYGLKKRATALEDFDNELHDDIDSGSHNLRRRVQLVALRRKLGDVHDALRKAKR
jgi:hypothetical protein